MNNENKCNHDYISSNQYLSNIGTFMDYEIIHKLMSSAVADPGGGSQQAPPLNFERLCLFLYQNVSK